MGEAETARILAGVFESMASQQKLYAERAKLDAEREKLDAEREKLLSESRKLRWEPMLMAAAAGAGMVTAGSALTGLILHFAK